MFGIVTPLITTIHCISDVQPHKLLKIFVKREQGARTLESININTVLFLQTSLLMCVRHKNSNLLIFFFFLADLCLGQDDNDFDGRHRTNYCLYHTFIFRINTVYIQNELIVTTFTKMQLT